MVKNPPANAGNMGDTGSIPGWGRFSWRRKWQPTPAFLPGESQGQRSLTGYRPWDRKESDMTERLSILPCHILKQKTTMALGFQETKSY